MRNSLLALIATMITVFASTGSAFATTHHAANSVCKPRQGQPAYYDDWFVANNSYSSVTQYVCPLKHVSCSAGGGCTYTATVYAIDVNGTDANDSNIGCQLVLQGLLSGYLTNLGTQVWHNNSNTPSTFNISVTLPSGAGGHLTALCDVGKNPYPMTHRNQLVYFSSVTD